MLSRRRRHHVATILLIAFAHTAHGEHNAPVNQAGRPRTIIVQLVDDTPVRSGYVQHKLSHNGALDTLENRFPIMRRGPLFASLHQQLESRLRQGDPAHPSSVDLDIARKHEARSQRARLRTSAMDLLTCYVLDVTDPQVDITQLCAAMRNDPLIAHVVPDRMVSITSPPNDPLLPRQWNLHNTGQPFPIPGGKDTGSPGSDIDYPEALEVFIPQQEVLVAVVDTGVDYDHPDLAERMWTDAAGRYGYDFHNEDDDPIDDNGHGTHCAGTIAASTGNGIGVAGVCPAARIMGIKFLNQFGNGLLSKGYDSIFYAVLNGADVISNSWGGASPDEIGQLVMDYAYGHGAIVIAAAGNANRSLEYYPAAFDKVIAVAATDARDHRADFSNYGSWVDIGAPGVNVLSLRAAGTDLSGTGGLSIVEEDYVLASGTSMACPHVAGATAVLLAHYPRLSIDDILLRLVNTADDLAPLNQGFEDALGTGRLNLHRALTDPRGPRQHLTAIAFEEIAGDGNGIPERGERVGLTFEIENTWTTAAGLTVVATSPDPFVDVIVGSTVLDALAIGERAQFTLTFELAADMPAPREVLFDIALTPHGHPTSYVAVPIGMGWPYLDGWPRTLTTVDDTVLPCVADIDLDGSPDIIASHVGQLHVLSATGQPLNDGWPVRTFDGRGFTAIGNLDADEELEIVLGGFAMTRAFDPDGSTLPGWPVNIPGQNVLCADMDGDGQDEVVITHLGVLHLLTGAGAAQSDLWPLSLNGTMGQPVVTDIDLDGDSEVFVMLVPDAAGPNLLLAYHHDGTQVDGWPIELDGAFSPDSVLSGDLTGDGHPEIVIAQNGATLHVLDRFGQPLNGYWPTTLADQDIRHIALADLTGDGALEIIGAGKSSPRIVAVDHRAQIVEGWPAQLPGRFSFFQPPGTTIHACGDLDGDGHPEIVVGASTGLYLFGADGRLIAEAPTVSDLDATTPGAVWLADVDADEDVELLLEADGQLVVHDFPAPARDVQWPGLRGSVSRSAAYVVPTPDAGHIAFDQSTYGLHTPLRITIQDTALDSDPHAVDHIEVLLSSKTELDPERIVAHETGPHQGVFVATMPLDDGPVRRDGQLQVRDADAIECAYFDGRTWHDHHAVIDGAPPEIADIALTPVFDGELYHIDVTWTTNEPADSRVHYGMGVPTGMISQQNRVVTHTLRISDAQRGETYVLALESTDPYGNLRRADNDGAYYEVHVPADDSTEIVVTHEGVPFDSAFMQLVVYDDDGRFVQKFSSRMLDPTGRVYYGLEADEPLRLVVTIISFELNLVATYALSAQHVPADIHLDLVSRTVTVREADQPLADAQVTPHFECWPAGPGRATDSSGRVDLLVPADVDISLQIITDTIYWTTELNTARVLPTIDIAELTPNVLIDVRHDGQPQADELVFAAGMVEGQLALLAESATTGPDGQAACYLCGGAPAMLQVESFPDEVRSVAFIPPPIATPPASMTLDLARPRIATSAPPHRAIDARQPPDAQDPTAWTTIDFEFTAPPMNVSVDAFELVQFGGVSAPPRITTVEAIDAQHIEVTLDHAPSPAAWTTVRHASSRSSVTLGVLPGDVDGDATSTARDILALIDALNGHHDLAAFATDIDRNGVADPADIVRAIDLLHGSDTDTSWRNRTLPWPYAIYWLDDDVTMRAIRPGRSDLHTVVHIDDLMSTLTSVAVDNRAASLYWSQSDLFDRGKIVRADLDGGNPQTIARADRPQAIAVDVLSGWVYWTERNGLIRRVAPTGGIVEDLVIQSPSMHSSALALAPAIGLMYWVSGQSIYHAGLEIPDGADPVNRRDIELLIGPEGMAPVGLAVDPHRGWLLWTSSTAHAVFRARLDGSAIEPIVTYGLDTPHGVTIDSRDGMMYFTDDGTNRIHRANIDGAHTDFAIILGLNNPTRLATP